MFLLSCAMYEKNDKKHFFEGKIFTAFTIIPRVGYFFVPSRR